MKAIEWVFREFQQLSASEVFDMLELRCEVFIVEQTCVYQDPDKKDRHSYHLLAYCDGILAGCLRIVKPGVSYPEASIGRVCTRRNYRGLGLGKQLMEEALKKAKELGYSDLRISAQLYLQKFYSDMGFVPVSEPYPEDNIPHIEMLLTRD